MLALNAAHVRAHFQYDREHVVVIKTVKLNLKKCECTSGSDCGLCYEIKTHTHPNPYTHTAVNNEAVSAGFKALVPAY